MVHSAVLVGLFCRVLAMVTADVSSFLNPQSVRGLAAWGVAEGDVSGAEGQFSDVQVGNEFGQ